MSLEACPASPLWGLRLTLAATFVTTLASASPSLEATLARLDRQVATPQDLGGGLRLLRARADGETWFQSVNAASELAPPPDPEFRAMIRARCADPVLGGVMARGGTVQESHTWGPQEIHVFTLRMTPDTCEQIGMEVGR